MLDCFITAAAECYSTSRSSQFSTASLCLRLHPITSQLSEGGVTGGWGSRHAHSFVPEPTGLAEGAH